MNEVILNNILVWSVSVPGVINSATAFSTLESKLPTLKGRKFYGCLLGDPINGVYRACVAKIDSDNFDFESWVIPAGKYIKSKINDWPGREYLIGQKFSEMSPLFSPDYSRPCIEFYKSQKELVLLFPIK